MANTCLPSNRAVAGRRWGRLTRGDILTVALAAMLCSASYCLSIWHNSRGAADSIVLGPSTVVVGDTLCGPDDELDFEAHHTAEKAGLSVSTAATTSARRALRGEEPMGTGYRGPFPWSASRGVVWAGNSARGAEAADGKGWATSSGSRTPEPSTRAPTPSSGSSRRPCAPLSTSEPCDRDFVEFR